MIVLFDFYIMSIAQSKVLEVTNLPCKLNVEFVGTIVDSSGGTNAIINYSIVAHGDEDYYVIALPGLIGNTLKCSLWSINKDNSERNQLFPKPLGDGSSVSTDETETLFNRDKPYSNRIVCPMKLLTNTEFGVIAKATIAKFENKEGLSLRLPTKSNHLSKIQNLYSQPILIPKK